MRILVTGATGLLGTDLCRTLSRRHEVAGWARRWKPQEAAATVKGESVDVTDPKAVGDGMRRWRPEAVIHCAALGDVDACERDPGLARAVNAEAVGTVARACASLSAFLIAVSTDYVFDGSSRRPYREEDIPSPVNLYGRMKWEGERLALKESDRCLVVRVSGLFGAARSNFVSQTVKRFSAGETVPAVTDQINSPSYTADLAEAMGGIVERMGEKPLYGILHLANSGSATRLEMAERIARFFHAEESLIRPTSWAALDRPARRPSYTALDCARYAEWAGVSLRNWSEALSSFLETRALDSRPVS